MICPTVALCRSPPSETHEPESQRPQLGMKLPLEGVDDLVPFSPHFSAFR